MLGWVIAVASVVVPVLAVVAWLAKGAAGKRGFDKFVRARGWTVSRGGGPLRRPDESVVRTVRGQYRGRPFGWSEYVGPGGGFNADGVRESGPQRTIVHIEVETTLPRWTLTVDGGQVTCPDGQDLRPDVEEWLVSGGYPTVYLSDHTIAVRSKGGPSAKRLLGALDFLNGVADRLPLR